jgi:Fe-S cluster assembly protein SufD
MSIIESTPQTGFTDDAYAAFLEGRREPEWLTGMRTDAWKAFNDLEMPNPRLEQWRRTDLRLFRMDRFGFPAASDLDINSCQPLLTERVDLAGRCVTVNSTAREARLAHAWRERGVVFGDLGQLVNQHEDLVRPHFLNQVIDPQSDKFAALGSAAWASGTLLYVPRDVKIEQPLHTLSVLTPDGANLGRTLIVLEDGAEATLLSETASVDQTAAGLHCGLIEIVVGAGARLRFVNLQNWGNGVWHFAHQKALVDAGGKLQWTIGALGARLAKVNQDVALVGPQAETEVNGVMFTEGRQHLAYHTLQHHEVAQCHSDLLYKCALQDKSRLVWRGMIKVNPDAQKTDAYQRNDNLILSDAARADSIPGLEIEADDVRCSHGATAGRVDDEMIFYAQNRGLTKKEATRMIVTGFFQQVFDRITIPSVRDALGDAIRRRVREYE